MPRLIALDLAAGPEFVDAVARAWDAGDAVFPLDQRLPDAERSRLLDALQPTHVRTAGDLVTRSTGRPAEDGDAVVIATSGTTGAPKAAVLTMDALAAATRMTADALAIGPNDRWLLCLPPAHVGGFGVVAKALLGGVSIDAHPRFDAAAVEAAGRNGATLVSLVPAVLHRLDPSLFRVILLGGSAIPPDRPANSIATYGLTETTGGVVYDGVPLDGVRIRVGDDGQVLVASPTLLRAYRDAPAVLTPDGYFPTGDIGTFEDGVLHVEGRMDEVIVTGGQKVWPQRVETVLRAHPDVQDVRVVGRPDPTWGSIVVAEIVSSSPPTLDELRSNAEEELPAYMAPRDLVVVEAIPRTSLGKIRRDRLSETGTP